MKSTAGNLDSDRPGYITVAHANAPPMIGGSVTNTLSGITSIRKRELLFKKRSKNWRARVISEELLLGPWDSNLLEVQVHKEVMSLQSGFFPLRISEKKIVLQLYEIKGMEKKLCWHTSLSDEF